MRLYDTRTRRVVDVRPATPGLLRVWSCGPTVYRYAHVGNLRTFLLADLVRRVAELDRLRVHLVQNITDVGHLADDTAVEGHHDTAVEALADRVQPGEDKVVAEAHRLGTTAERLARHYEEAFHRDLAALNIRPAQAHPRASESVPLMIALIDRLLATGAAYVGGGSVFFDARRFPSYGALSGNSLDRLRPGHRVEGVDPAKRSHADWVLWRRAGDRREMTWDSPWGRGFPGWHVECSAMLLHHLGPAVDVHVGGVDLRFPHHEDERAQTDTVVGREVVRLWLHGEHVLFEGRKMSKSAGNVVLLSDVSQRGLDPLAVRLAFLGVRYRTQTDLTWRTLVDADAQLRRWRARVAAWAESPSRPIAGSYADEAVSALREDLDTPAALRTLRRLDQDASVPDGAKFETAAYLDRVLALDLVRDVGRAPPAAPALPPGAEDLLVRRAAARAERDWAAADRLRDELAARGVAVRDTPSGQEWSPLADRLPPGSSS